MRIKAKLFVCFVTLVTLSLVVLHAAPIRADENSATEAAYQRHGCSPLADPSPKQAQACLAAANEIYALTPKYAGHQHVKAMFDAANAYNTAAIMGAGKVYQVKACTLFHHVHDDSNANDDERDLSATAIARNCAAI